MGHFINGKLEEIKILFSTQNVKWTMKNMKEAGCKYI